MNKLTETAKNKLKSNNLTCVVYNAEGIVFSSASRGVTPLIEFLDTNNEAGPFYLADKVIGKAAALLCVRAGMSSVYADVMSSGASDILNANGIKHTYGNLVKHIRNRDQTDLCPMEKLSAGVETHEEMYVKIKDWLSSQQSS